MLEDMVRFWAQWRPDGLAICQGERNVSWSMLDEESDAIARRLFSEGVRRGDRVAILMGNCPEYAEAAIAAWRIGAAVVLVNLLSSAREVLYVVEDSDCAVVVSENSLSPSLDALDGRRRVIMREDLAKGGSEADYIGVRNSPDDLATICYTSGTTGNPKGAMLSHRNWACSCRAFSAALDFNSKERILLPFPMAFTGGFAVWLWGYYNGCPVYLERKVDSDRLLDIIVEKRITWFSGVPTVIQCVVENPRFDSMDTSCWTKGLMGGANVPLPLLEKCMEKGVSMAQLYGMTESAGSGTLLPYRDARRKMGSAGRALMHQGVRIAGLDGGACPIGEVGEIQLRGGNVAAGYWGNAEATAALYAEDGWMRTGDLGYLDDEGYLYFVDRLKDMIVSGGLNVYPAEIERVLQGLAGVKELAVIGVPDEKWQETPMVVASLEPGASLDAEAVMEPCRRELARYKFPKYLVTTYEDLPRNMAGKVVKKAVGDRYGNLADAVVLPR